MTELSKASDLAGVGASLAHGLPGFFCARCGLALGDESLVRADRGPRLRVGLRPAGT